MVLVVLLCCYQLLLGVVNNDLGSGLVNCSRLYDTRMLPWTLPFTEIVINLSSVQRVPCHRYDNLCSHVRNSPTSWSSTRFVYRG